MNRWKLPWLLVCFVFSCHTASKRPESERQGCQPATDALGREICIPRQPARVMGLSPALTEMLFFMLRPEQICAVTQNCNFPPLSVKGKPIINTYPLDIENLALLKPDLIFAEKGINSPQDIQQIEKMGIPVFLFEYKGIADILDAMDSIGKWCGARSSEKLKLDSLVGAYQNLNKISREMKEANRPAMLAITWLDPVFAYGYNTWMTEKMDLSLGRNALIKELDQPYPSLSRETILELNPDIIFGRSYGRMDSTFFRMYPELRKVKAYQNKMIFELNDDLASRPGPRFLEGIQEIRSARDQWISILKGARQQPKPQ